jgi:hypothetical protein
MPTTRQRHLLTETDELAAAIDNAAPLFPGESRADVLRHLVAIGADTVGRQRHQRLALVTEHAGHFPALYPADYLQDLRSDWPE